MNWEKGEKHEDEDLHFLIFNWISLNSSSLFSSSFLSFLSLPPGLGLLITRSGTPLAPSPPGQLSSSL